MSFLLQVPGRSYGEMFIFGYQIAMGDDVGLKEIFKFDYDNKTMTVCEGYAFQRFFEHIYKYLLPSPFFSYFYVSNLLI